MSIELQTVKQTTELCRHCLMCRHVCPVTHVTRTEATSPHGWGILVASVERGVVEWNQDNVDVLYQCADCGLCQSFCVTDQPLPLALNAARADVVAQQKAPGIVYELQQKLQQWGNPYAIPTPSPVTESGEVVLIVGAFAYHFQEETIAAAIKLLTTVGINVVPVARGRENAYFANTLGLIDEARSLAQQTVAEIEQVGAKRAFVLGPDESYTYQTIFDYIGMSWPETVEVIDITVFLAHQLDEGNISFQATELSDYTFFDPDQTVRVSGRWDAPRKLLAALSPTPPTELFWRKERAAPSGVSGALQFTQPELSAKLAQTRLAEAQERGIKTVISDDPQVLHHLRNQTANSELNIEIVGLFELLAANLK